MYRIVRYENNRVICHLWQIKETKMATKKAVVVDEVDKGMVEDFLFGVKLNKELEGLNDDFDVLEQSIKNAATYIQVLRAKVRKLNDSIEL